MNLQFLGLGSAFYTERGNTSAYLREGEKLLLLDCGESVFRSLTERQLLDGVKTVYAAISHTHTDHCGSLGSLALYCKFAGDISLKLILPAQEPEYAGTLRQLMSVFGVWEDYYGTIEDCGLDGIFSSFLTLRYVPTIHDRRMSCHSFVFETAQGGVFFSADTAVTDTVEVFLSTHENFEKVYMEATDVLIPGDVHVYMPRLERLFPPEIRKRVYLMHFRNRQCIRAAEEKGFQIPYGCEEKV